MTDYSDARSAAAYWKRAYEDMAKVVDQRNAQIAQLARENTNLRDQLDGVRPQQIGDEDEGGIDYTHWLNDQFWPEGATHATIDKQGGCIWWKEKPVLAPNTEYGWKPRAKGGELVERYFDPTMRMSGPKWKQSLVEKPEEET